MSASETPEPRRLRLTGLHHVTVICSSLERAVAFYRDLLGMRVVRQSTNPDGPNARHFFFGDAEGAPGTIVSCLEYPEMEPGTVGVGSTHHFALRVESDSALAAWREYLTARGVACTDVLDRTYFKSIYLRDPDGHVIELATGAPGLGVE